MTSSRSVVNDGVVLEAQVRDVVDDPDGEVPLRLGPGELVEDRDGHGRRELLGGEAVPPADDPGEPPATVALRRPGLDQGGDDVLVERLAEGARLLGPVQDRDAPDRRRQGGEEGPGVEGAVEPDLDQADLLAPRDQRLDRLLHGPRARAHHDDHALGVRGARRSRRGGTAARRGRRSGPWSAGGSPAARDRTGSTPRGPGRRRPGSAPSRAGPGGPARATALGGPGPTPRRSSPGCRPAPAVRSC